MIGAFADFALLSAEDGGLRTAMQTPCRSLLLRLDGGGEIGEVVLGVLISRDSGDSLTPGEAVTRARFDFWDDVAAVYVTPGQAFELCYPIRAVARGTITSLFPVGPV